MPRAIRHLDVPALLLLIVVIGTGAPSRAESGPSGAAPSQRAGAEEAGGAQAGGEDLTAAAPPPAAPAPSLASFVPMPGGAGDPEAETPAADGRPLDREEAAALLDGLPEPGAAEPGAAEPSAAEPSAAEPTVENAPGSGEAPMPSQPPSVAAATEPAASSTTAAAAAPPSSAGLGAGPLTVLRRAPEGEVPAAERVSITFSQPMVPVGVREPDPAAPPARLQPRVPGRWRWVGTQTVVFEPEGDRLPMASRFAVTIPEGLTSQLGGRLGQRERFEFQTSPPQVQRLLAPKQELWSSDTGALPRAPALALVFDQRVDAQAVVESLELTAAGVPHPVEPLAPEDLEASWRGPLEVVEPGRLVLFRPARPLPAGATAELTVPAGLRGQEGPVVTREPQTFQLSVQGPLTIEQVTIEDGRPVLHLSGRLLEEEVDPAQVKLEPEVTHLGVRVHWGWGWEDGGSRLKLDGTFDAGTRYRVEIHGLKDERGRPPEAPLAAEFVIDRLLPRIHVPDDRLVTLPMEAPAILPVHVQGLETLRIQLRRVTRADWRAFRAGAETCRESCGLRPPNTGEGMQTRHECREDCRGQGAVVGRAVSTDVRRLEPRRPRQLAVDLSPVLGTAPGHVLVALEGRSETGEIRRRTLWVTRTGLAQSVEHGVRHLGAWVTRGPDAEPVAGAVLTTDSSPATTRTDADGLGTLPVDEGPTVVWAVLGEDAVPTPLFEFGKLPRVRRWPVVPGSGHLGRTTWFTMTDRPIYKPGERVHVKGWLRTVGEETELRLPRPDLELSWQVELRGHPTLEGVTSSSRLGGFDFSFDLPEDVTSFAYVKITARDPLGELPRDARFWVLVRDHRRPSFEVEVRLDEDIVAGTPVTAEVEARAYTGQPLVASQVDWTARVTPTSWAPPGHEAFEFGPERYARCGSWDCGGYGLASWSRRLLHRAVGDRDGAEDWLRLEDDTTDDRGRSAATLTLAADGIGPGRLTLEARVRDLDRQEVVAKVERRVHPASRYVGIRLPEAEPAVGRVPLQVLVTDLQGRMREGHDVAVVAERLVPHWDELTGTRATQITARRTCRARSAAQATVCPLPLEKPGWWRLTARVFDPEGREQRTVRTVRVRAPEGQVGEGRSLEAGPAGEAGAGLSVPTTPVQPGRPMTVEVRLPFAPARARLVLRCADTDTVRQWLARERVEEVEIPVARRCGRNVHVGLEALAVSPDASPAAFEDRLSVPVDLDPWRLHVRVEPEAGKAAPGQSQRVRLVVRTPEGRPARGAEVAVVAVDEAVLDLASSKRPDPLKDLVDPLPAAAVPSRSRDWQVHPEQWTPAHLYSMGVGGMGKTKFGRKLLAALRGDIRPLALWAPSVWTDHQGQAEVEMQLPDDLTRWRILAVAAHGAQRFGVGEAAVTTQLPLTVRPALPRFLRQGDRFEAAAVVQNDGPTASEVRVAVHGRGIELAVPGRLVRLPRGGRTEVRLPARAGTADEAVVQWVVVAPGEAVAALQDAVEVRIPLHAPARQEHAATYGVLRSGLAARSVSVPAEARPGSGAIDISAASSRAGSLRDAAGWMERYPYHCTEQIASRVLARLALASLPVMGEANRRVAEDAFVSDSGVASADASESAPHATTGDGSADALRADIARLLSRRGKDGAFPLWGQGDLPHEFASVHAAHALLRARMAGHLSARELEPSLDYLEEVAKGEVLEELPPDASTRIRAYAVHVLHEAGRPAASLVPAVVAEAGGAEALPVEAAGWLLAASAGASSMEGALRARIVRSLEETSAYAQVETAGPAALSWRTLQTPFREDAVVLDALTRTRPDDPLNVRLAEGLLRRWKDGHWGTTQTNAFALLALARHLDRVEGESAVDHARVWVGEQLAADWSFTGHSAHEVEMPLPARGSEPRRVVFEADGDGPLYWRLGLRWLPDGLRPALDRGLSVTRRYEAVDDPADVRQDADGTWHLRAGARIRVVLNVRARGDRRHVALVDPLPAGLEAGHLRAGREGWGWVWQHREVADDEARAFAAHLPAGWHEWSYVVRATTLGHFAAPGARAEEMYQPETFGRSADEQVVVVPGPR